jgi:hypothetical protein
MTDHDGLLSRLAQAVADGESGRPLTWRACHAVNGMLGADGASITIENSTVARVTLCATDRRAEMLANLQDVLGEGPCRDAFDSGRPYEISLRRAGSRWPQFIPAAERIIGADGVVWSIPMRSDADVIGAISLYRLRPGRLTLPIGGAGVLADAVAALLLHDPLAFAMFTGPGEEGGWSSRSLVQQATGMLMGQLGISVDDALAILRSYAFATDTQLADVARDVVGRELDLSGL